MLDVRELKVEYETAGGPFTAVDGVSFALGRGEALAIVGETGCGKSSLVLAIGRLLPDSASVSGQALFGGQDLLSLPEAALRRCRRQMGVIFQDPASALDPMMRAGKQIAEALPEALPQEAKKRRVAELLAAVGLAPEVARAYPHTLSGGMQQRVMLAAALANGPALLMADEPTTALDLTTQAQILRLLQAQRQSLGCALLFITHDLGVAARLASRIAVMHAGRFVEVQPTARLFSAPAQPYTRALLQSFLALDVPQKGVGRRA